MYICYCTELNNLLLPESDSSTVKQCYDNITRPIGDPNVLYLILLISMATLQPKGTNQPAISLAAVSVKIPPFWPADPQVWFAQIEAQFTTRNMSSHKTRFDYVVASLAPEFATEVRDLILKPPEEDPYDALKEQLIRCTAASEQCRLQMLFNAEKLGYSKPTQLLQRMQQLL